MNKKLINIKKAIETLSDIEKDIIDARKTIKHNKLELNHLKGKLSWEKSNKIDTYYTKCEIYNLEADSDFKRRFIKEAKIEKCTKEQFLKNNYQL
tara:strand:+ start:1687 stop:1971 length:285 start_codon:yes stop_codon:yes gene_type:complete